MTNHLPECPVPELDGLWGLPLHPEDAEINCICDRLRACEQRMYEWSRSFGVGKTFYNAGRLDALDAAREAVNALASTTVEFHGPLPVVHNVRITDALAAIDALKEKP